MVQLADPAECLGHGCFAAGVDHDPSASGGQRGQRGFEPAFVA
jgi:hypothetical protein